MAWSDVCLPKREGGLSFRDLKAWNSALLSKTLWNICAKKDSLWIQWVNHEYLRGRSIWDKTIHVRDSPLFKNLFAIRDKLLLHFANGSSAVEHLSKWHNGLVSNNSSAYDFFGSMALLNRGLILFGTPLLPLSTALFCGSA